MLVQVWKTDSDFSAQKKLEIYDLKLLNSWATRIRTLKMLESESSALPFGDSPLPQQMVVYINDKKNASVFLKKIKKLFWTFWRRNKVRFPFCFWKLCTCMISRFFLLRVAKWGIKYIEKDNRRQCQCIHMMQ